MAAVILPVANRADIADSFGNELPCGISVRYARTMNDVLEVAPPDIVALRMDRLRRGWEGGRSGTALAGGEVRGPRREGGAYCDRRQSPGSRRGPGRCVPTRPTFLPSSGRPVKAK